MIGEPFYFYFISMNITFLLYPHQYLLSFGSFSSSFFSCPFFYFLLLWLSRFFISSLSFIISNYQLLIIPYLTSSLSSYLPPFFYYLAPFLPPYLSAEREDVDDVNMAPLTGIKSVAPLTDVNIRCALHYNWRIWTEEGSEAIKKREGGRNKERMWGKKWWGVDSLR